MTSSQNNRLNRHTTVHQIVVQDQTQIRAEVLLNKWTREDQQSLGNICKLSKRKSFQKTSKLFLKRYNKTRSKD